MFRWIFSSRPTSRARGQRGQAMVVFALLIMMVLLLLGVAVDSVRLFIVSAQAERAGEAGALAGAIYLPNYFNTLASDGQDAITRACALVQQNGITACPVSLGQTGATVSLLPGYPYRLQVTITEPANLFFLSTLSPSFNTATVSRSVTAEYLPPINQGIQNAKHGEEDDDDEGDDGIQPQQWYWAQINGPLEVKENGDAYTPLYEEGPTDPIAAPDSIGSTPYNLNRFPIQTGTQTNHPNYAGGAIVNPDKQPAGFVGAGGTGSYNYEINIPSGATPINLEVFNLPFAAGNTMAATHPINDSLGSACFDPKLQTGGTCDTDSADAYLQLNYSVYSAPLQFERAADVLLNGPSGYSPDSLDMLPADLSKHGCAAAQAYDPTLKTCVAVPASLDAWSILYTFNSPGIYRLSIEATGGYGLHDFALQLTDASRHVVTNGAHIWWWTDMCISFASTATKALYGIAVIPAEYAGKTLNFDFFNLGASPGTTYVELLDPSSNPVTFPSWVTTVVGSGGTMIDASSYRYHGEWLRIPVSIPLTYNPAPGKGWWRLRFTSPAGNLSMVMSITITLGQSPVHLVV